MFYHLPTHIHRTHLQTYRNIYIGGCISNAYIYIQAYTHMVQGYAHQKTYGSTTDR